MSSAVSAVFVSRTVEVGSGVVILPLHFSPFRAPKALELWNPIVAFRFIVSLSEKWKPLLLMLLLSYFLSNRLN